MHASANNNHYLTVFVPVMVSSSTLVASRIILRTLILKNISEITMKSLKIASIRHLRCDTYLLVFNKAVSAGGQTEWQESTVNLMIAITNAKILKNVVVITQTLFTKWHSSKIRFVAPISTNFWKWRMLSDMSTSKIDKKLQNWQESLNLL